MLHIYRATSNFAMVFTRSHAVRIPCNSFPEAYILLTALRVTMHLNSLCVSRNSSPLLPRHTVTVTLRT